MIRLPTLYTQFFVFSYLFLVIFSSTIIWSHFWSQNKKAAKIFFLTA